MNYTIKITHLPVSDVETVRAIEAVLRLKGVVPLKTILEALPHLCSFAAAMSRLETSMRDRRYIDRTPVIRKSLDSQPGFDQVYLLDFLLHVPPSIVEALPAPPAVIPSAPSVPATPPAPVPPVNPLSRPLPPRRRGSGRGYAGSFSSSRPGAGPARPLD